jgi:hypothetical protein
LQLLCFDFRQTFVKLLYLKFQLKFALIILLSISCFDLSAQKSSVLNQTVNDSGFLYSDSSLKISYEKAICHPNIGFDQELLLVTFENLSDDELKIRWHSQFYYNGECKTCDFADEYTFELELPPNSSLSGDCAISDQRLTVFSKFIDSNYKGNTQLTHLSFENLTIQK